MEQKELFRNPTARYRAKPFWAWNGRLEETELQRQIDAFREMGFGGFFMHSRTGLETEYLGAEWMQAVASCIEYGEERGLEPWLYDEDRWPSGSAGGLATAERKYRASFLQVEQKHQLNWKKIEEEEKENIAFFACRMQGNSFSEKRRLQKGDMLQEGETALEFSIVEAPCREVYNGNTYLDTMNREAVEHFIKHTHEKYAKELSEENLEKVCGIFTDEPHRGPLFTTFNGGREEWVPYTPKLFDTFAEAYGYDLMEYLPELFYREKEKLLSKVTYQYIALCQELFLENFAKPIQEWCHTHQMKLTGHVLHEDSLIAQTLMQGSLMRFYEYMDIPGIDHLLRDNCCFWIVKQVVSVARQLGKTQILSELYGATGWKTTLEEYKQIGDWQTLFGINVRCPHLAWYTMKGEAKRDYPASISSHLAGWKEYRYLEDYFSRLHVFLDQGEEKTGLLVLCPIESIWARSYSGAYGELQSRDPVIDQVEKIYETLFTILTRDHLGFDYGEEGLLASHASVQNGMLKVGCCEYGTVLVCGMLTMRDSTLQLLQKLRDSGGKVIFAGEIPAYVEAVLSDEPRKLAEKSICISLEEEQIVKACEGECILSVSGDGRKEILVCQRKAENRVYYMLLNQNRKEKLENIKICFENAEKLEEWNARTGEVNLLFQNTHSEGAERKLEWSVDLAPGEEKLFGVKLFEERTEMKILSIPESCGFSLSEKNLCVLDQVSVRFETPDGTEHFLEKMEVLRADREVRKILGYPMRGGEMLQPWYRMKYDNETGKRQQFSVYYSFEIKKKTDKIVFMLENTEHVRKIRVNQMEVTLSFKKQWIDRCFGQVELSEYLLQEGRNIIEVVQEFEAQDGLEAAYLQGDFSVYLESGKNPVLSQLPKKLKWGDITQQGFPFYSGMITYCIPRQQEYLKKLRITAKDWQGWTLAFVDTNGKEHFAGFAPYVVCCDGLKEIRLFLTRKNTFGPLHEKNPDPALCEPGSFLTVGSNWSEAYVLQRQGMMAPPILEVIE